MYVVYFDEINYEFIFHRKDFIRELVQILVLAINLSSFEFHLVSKKKKRSRSRTINRKLFFREHLSPEVRFNIVQNRLVYLL